MRLRYFKMLAETLNQCYQLSHSRTFGKTTFTLVNWEETSVKKRIITLEKLNRLSFRIISQEGPLTMNAMIT